jgi:hypothetical protein
MKPIEYPSEACCDSWVSLITIIREIGNNTCVKNAQKIARSTAMELAIDHQPLTRIDNQKIAHMPSFRPAQRSTNHAPDPPQIYSKF